LHPSQSADVNRSGSVENPSDPLRPSEVAVEMPARADAGLVFVGRIRTPWHDRAACPRQGDEDGPECRIAVDPPWDRALQGIEASERLEVLYWMHLARRDLVLQTPGHGSRTQGTFSLRSPIRPNPIAAARVRLVRREGATLVVRGLDCVDGTPLIDLKPIRCTHGGAAKD
jgi:tRNA (adenine37-N6)-methyltransferase